MHSRYGMGRLTPGMDALTLRKGGVTPCVEARTQGVDRLTQGGGGLTQGKGALTPGVDARTPGVIALTPGVGGLTPDAAQALLGGAGPMPPLVQSPS
jgi:hypothetical protein